MSFEIADRICSEAGMYLPDPMDANESIAIFRNESNHPITMTMNTGLRQVPNSRSEAQWIAVSNKRIPEIYWEPTKFYETFRGPRVLQLFQRPRQTFGLCLYQFLHIQVSKLII
ncbi:unnamed protein product [Oikopleura dioica]|uniref:Uncharacterized protein n=1 Tax=Oikopleura dioica TaxID=34765 RepID=E4XR36_OIKDI|nr:unnamed protein product [Oikopleura dioica]